MEQRDKVEKEYVRETVQGEGEKTSESVEGTCKERGKR